MGRPSLPRRFTIVQGVYAIKPQLIIFKMVLIKAKEVYQERNREKMAKKLSRVVPHPRWSQWVMFT